MSRSIFTTRFVLLATSITLFLSGCSSAPSLPHLPADAVVLAFGDSITFGTGADRSQSYPVVLAQLIGRTVINGGSPGEVTSQGVLRLPELLESERPALLILCHGGNDLLQHLEKEKIAANLRTMIRSAREQGVHVILVGVPSPDISLTPPGFYREVAEEFSIPYDAKSLPGILGKRGLKSDYIHPNAAGYRMLAENLAKLLARAGAV